ncbi:uncharacterized protein BT62DRAFT_977861 [Guyanagaster necrorhizus]|uniref:Deoxycytidylate deaminase n=1 Tax=Guyanagaster necrorhizus TaxID=856835 RepID=A0A9P7W530_9AGAR|nr:uncharacterized protein BT62DRAFT_977861 [Guyanagaster necrorhizus MCA 3950]KAG7452309.1 hypothetical protein BT62DRAFT_977861 [Guyanagaster necrorhizus MCA 3950]
MFIAIIGTASAGKSTVEEYLVAKEGFTPIRLSKGTNADVCTRSDAHHTLPYSNARMKQELPEYDQVEARPFEATTPADASVLSDKHLSFLSLDPTPIHSPGSFHFKSSLNMTLTFDTPSAMLDYVTRNWRTRFVTVDLCTREQVERFIKRPFFMLLCIDAPIFDRYRRSNRNSIRAHLHLLPSHSLEDFVRTDDEHVFGQGKRDSRESLKGLNDLVHIKIINDFRSVAALHSHLNDLNILHPCRLRPDWDTYFMTLASLAAERSNCMKRRVGAILVRDNRILSTGYNGTPRHLLNCNEGGCSHCNGTTILSDDTDHCICLHAEENALLEAGRERVGVGSVLYCNTCPCLKCTIKIIQTGVTAVVYNLSYKVSVILQIV